MGNRAGIPNKNKSFLLKRLQDMYGEDFHPIIKMAENAVKLEEIAQSEGDTNSHKAALEGWDKVAQYTEPKLKAVEVSGDIGLRTVVKIVDLSGQTDADD